MKKTLLRAVALTAALSLSVVNVGFAAGGSIGHGDISVYKSDLLASKLSGQNPVEDGALLVCDGKCMIKSEGISLIARDNAQIAVTNETDVFKLYVKEGKVDYIISSNVRKIAFHTPQGTYTVADVIFNAGSKPVVKGNVVVKSDGSTEITVTEGRMVFATADGMKTVDANNKIVLAVAPGGAGVGLGAILATVAVATGFVFVAVNDGDGDTGGGDTGGGTPPADDPPDTGGGTPPADDDDDDDDDDVPASDPSASPFS